MKDMALEIPSIKSMPGGIVRLYKYANQSHAKRQCDGLSSPNLYKRKPPTLSPELVEGSGARHVLPSICLARHRLRSGDGEGGFGLGFGFVRLGSGEGQFVLAGKNVALTFFVYARKGARVEVQRDFARLSSLKMNSLKGSE